MDFFGSSWLWCLFRNSYDTQLKMYFRKIRTCDTLYVEMWGMYLRMQLIWRHCFHYLSG